MRLVRGKGSFDKRGILEVVEGSILFHESFPRSATRTEYKCTEVPGSQSCTVAADIPRTMNRLQHLNSLKLRFFVVVV